VAAPFVAVVDSEQVRAAVTVALDAAMENMVGEIASRVFAALQARPPGDQVSRQAEPEEPHAAEPPHVDPLPVENVRRVTSLRHRSGSILGLDTIPSEPRTLE
jgi:hypothetical protein